MQPSFSSSPSYERIKRLNAIGIALSAQKDQGKLLEMILNSARELTHADVFWSNSNGHFNEIGRASCRERV